MSVPLGRRMAAAVGTWARHVPRVRANSVGRFPRRTRHLRRPLSERTKAPVSPVKGVRSRPRRGESGPPIHHVKTARKGPASSCVRRWRRRRVRAGVRAGTERLDPVGETSWNNSAGADPQHQPIVAKPFPRRGVDTERRGVCHALYLAVTPRSRFRQCRDRIPRACTSPRREGVRPRSDPGSSPRLRTTASRCLRRVSLRKPAGGRPGFPSGATTTSRVTHGVRRRGRSEGRVERLQASRQWRDEGNVISTHRRDEGVRGPGRGRRRGCARLRRRPVERRVRRRGLRTAARPTDHGPPPGAGSSRRRNGGRACSAADPFRSSQA